jgi:adenosylmethionine-8-amino-7-oxononanoate aminotransferase
MDAIQKQMQKFEHVILANTTNEVIVELSEKLCQLSPNLNKVFYAGDGSTALEIALKMSFHAQQRLGNSSKKLFVGLENGYHGETLLTLGISDLGIYKKPYDQLWSEAHYLEKLTYTSGKDDPHFKQCPNWPELEAQLLKKANQISAIVVEPLIQGAGGMLIYSADLLQRLRNFCNEHQIHLIADEVLTGFGRSGKMLACEWANIEPDFMCLSKGLTGGTLPMSAMLTKNSVYNLFYGDYQEQIAFMHSNTHCGNALAAAAALGAFKIMEQENILQKTNTLGEHMKQAFENISKKTKRLCNLRQLGGVVAADLILEPDRSNQRIGYQIYREAVERGALLRPLGNTLYWLPPLNTPLNVIDQLESITTDSIQAILN